MSRLLGRHEEAEDHDVSKELFLGIMMLMLALGIMVLNVAQPVWRVHRHDPVAGDVVVLYTRQGMGLSRDGHTVGQVLGEAEFRRVVAGMVTQPQADLHLFLKGGSREMLLRHAAYADSLLSTDPSGRKVRTAVYVHTW
ncbi:MAG: hypothetical protein AB1505_12405 [Candidatus Latescibacterota bacterium]